MNELTQEERELINEFVLNFPEASRALLKFTHQLRILAEEKDALQSKLYDAEIWRDNWHDKSKELQVKLDALKELLLKARDKIPCDWCKEIGEDGMRILEA